MTENEIIQEFEQIDARGLTPAVVCPDCDRSPEIFPYWGSPQDLCLIMECLNKPCWCGSMLQINGVDIPEFDARDYEVGPEYTLE